MGQNLERDKYKLFLIYYLYNTVDEIVPKYFFSFYYLAHVSIITN